MTPGGGHERDLPIGGAFFSTASVDSVEVPDRVPNPLAARHPRPKLPGDALPHARNRFDIQLLQVLDHHLGDQWPEWLLGPVVLGLGRSDGAAHLRKGELGT